MAFYTLGYASFDLVTICEAIGGVEATLVDVRMSPFSKKPGFRRKELQAALPGRYAHISEFGNANYGEKSPHGIKIRDYAKGREVLGGIASRTRRPVVLMCGFKEEQTSMASGVMIWHNPQCSKSRETLEIIKDRGFTPQIRLYLETPPTADELRDTLRLLGLSAQDFVRKKESVYTELGLDGGNVSESDLIQAMICNPILIERPVVFHDGQARIGRPPEKVLQILGPN